MISRTNQVYAEVGGQPLRYDLFRPDTQEEVPLVICIHGGGWISGSKEDHHDIARFVASQGCAAATPSYRLAPLHPFPAAVDDIHTFVKFAREHAPEWKIDPKRVASLGNSAGGHLACMAGLTGDQSVNAVVAICPITDLTKPRDQHFAISWAFLEEFMGVPYEGNEDLYRKASPLFNLTSNLPPFLIVHGEEDDIVPIAQSDALAEALNAHGTRVEYHRLANEAHSFSPEAWNDIASLFAKFLENNFSHALR